MVYEEVKAAGRYVVLKGIIAEEKNLPKETVLAFFLTA